MNISKSSLGLPLAFLLLLCVYVGHSSADQERASKKVCKPSITEQLLSARTSHPAKFAPPSGQINVTMIMSLVNILTVDRKRDEVEFIARLSYLWSDSSLAWATNADDTSEDTVSLPSSLVWVPDIVPYTATDQVVDLFPANVVVSRSGDVTYVPAQKMTNSCKVDKQREGVTSCRVKMGSWTLNANRLNLLTGGLDKIDLNSFQNSRFDILSTNVTRHEKNYPCCPETYVYMTFDFTFYGY